MAIPCTLLCDYSLLIFLICRDFHYALTVYEAIYSQATLIMSTSIKLKWRVITMKRREQKKNSSQKIILTSFSYYSSISAPHHGIYAEMKRKLQIKTNTMDGLLWFIIIVYYNFSQGDDAYYVAQIKSHYVIMSDKMPTIDHYFTFYILLGGLCYRVDRKWW